MNGKYQKLENKQLENKEFVSSPIKINNLTDFQKVANPIDFGDLKDHPNISINNSDFYEISNSLNAMATKMEITKILKEEPMDFFNAVLVPLRKGKKDKDSNFLIALIKKNEKMLLDHFDNLENKLGIDYQDKFIKLTEKEDK